jgi:hypothetical protein
VDRASPRLLSVALWHIALAYLKYVVPSRTVQGSNSVGGGTNFRIQTLEVEIAWKMGPSMGLMGAKQVLQSQFMEDCQWFVVGE